MDTWVSQILWRAEGLPFLPKCSLSAQRGETLFLYLGVADRVVNAVLVREEEWVQRLVYYAAKTLLDAETRYLRIEK